MVEELTREQLEERVKRLYGVIEHVIDKHEIKVKTCSEAGQRASEYVRGADLAERVDMAALVKKFPWLKKEADELSLASLATLCMELGVLQRAKWRPLGGEDARVRPKWPKHLASVEATEFDAGSFYIIRFERNKTWQAVKLGAIIAVVLAGCLYPAWPTRMRFASWYLSVVLLSMILTLVVVRIVLFLGAWFAGYDFWLFPTLFDDDAGFFESFVPLYTFETRKDELPFIAARVLLIALTVATGYQLTQTHSVDDVANFARQGWTDVLDWGYEKLAPPEAVDIFKLDPTQDP